MEQDAPGGERFFAAPDGGRWRARIVSRGGASPYLAAKVNRPLVEFERVEAPAVARRYAPLSGTDTLGALADAALVALWAAAHPS